MSKHTTLRIGGPADWFLIIDDTDKLVHALQYLDGEGEQYFILGGGSNVLVSDEGYRGVVIEVKSQELKVKSDRIETDAGRVMSRIAEESIKAGLTGLEWAIGIPGTIGGAVRGSAGANGGEMKDSVEKVVVYRDCEVLELSNEDCKFDYRESIFKHNGDVILGVVLKLKKGENKELAKKAMENLKFRNETQPKGLSCGCVFKNSKVKSQKSKVIDVGILVEFIEKGIIPAGWLIEQVGMKGRQVGGAKVSEKHANFILNDGSAKAADYFALIEEIKEKVYNKYKIALEEEIKILK